MVNIVCRSPKLEVSVLHTVSLNQSSLLFSEISTEHRFRLDHRRTSPPRLILVLNHISLFTQHIFNQANILQLCTLYALRLRAWYQSLTLVMTDRAHHES